MKAKSIWFSIWACVAMLLIQFGIGLIGTIMVAVKSLIEVHSDFDAFLKQYSYMINESGIVTVIELAATFICAIIMVIWYYNGYCKKEKKAGTYKSALPLFREWRFDAFLVAVTLGVFGLSVLIQIATEAMLPNVASLMNDVLSLALGGNQVIALLAAVVFAPICEEVTIRGIALRRCERAFGLVGCMLITAVLFGVMHLNPIQGLYALPMGLAWGFIGYKTHSVIPGIVCHALNNLAGTLLGNYIDPEQYPWVYAIFFLVFGALAFVLGKKIPCITNNTDSMNADASIGLEAVDIGKDR